MGFGAEAEKDRRGQQAIQEGEGVLPPRADGASGRDRAVCPARPGTLAGIADRLLCELEERTQYGQGLHPHAILPQPPRRWQG